jgi:hypothetical protein
MTHVPSDSNPRGVSGKNTFVNDIVSITRNAPDDVSAWKRVHAFLEDGIFSETPISYEVTYCHKGKVICNRVVSVNPGETKKEVVNQTIQHVSFEFGIDISEIQVIIESPKQQQKVEA